MIICIIIEEFLPLMSRIAQWVQILSSSRGVTCSLVIPAIQEVQETLKNLKNKATLIRDGDNRPDIVNPVSQNVTLGKQLLQYHECFEKNFEKYLQPILEDSLNITASFLDPRFILTLSDYEWNTAERYIKDYIATEAESTIVDADEINSNRAALRGSVTDNKTAFQIQLAIYMDIIGGLSEEDLLSYDPLVFWGKEDHRSKIPIIYRAALIILAAQATSSDVERLFSQSGNMNRVQRCSLNPNTTKELIFLKSVYLERKVEKGNLTKMEIKRRDRAEKFAKLVALNGKLVPQGNIVDAPDPESDDDDDRELSIFDEGRVYNGEIKVWPSRGMKDIKEGIPVSVWFGAPTNNWEDGILKEIHKGKKYVDNVVVYYKKELKGYQFNFNKDNYGKDKLWIMPIAVEGSGSVEGSEEEEEEVSMSDN